MAVLIRIWKDGTIADWRTRRVGLCRSLMVAAAVLFMAGFLAAQESAAQHANGTSDTATASPEYELVPEATKPAGTVEELISPDDQLDVFVMDVPELTRQYRVTTAGLIEVPLLKKPIVAAGLTPEQLAQTIREKLQAAGMVNDPFVTVQVASSHSHTVTIAGPSRIRRSSQCPRRPRCLTRSLRRAVWHPTPATPRLWRAAKSPATFSVSTRATRLKPAANQRPAARSKST